MLRQEREPITVTREVLEALASRTRVSILMHLRNGQKTLTSLSREMGKSKATLHEHLVKLQEAGLVEKQESRGKWVYYELTSRGRRLVEGRPMAVKFYLLGFVITILMAISALWNLVRPYRLVPVGSGARPPVLWLWFFAFAVLSVFFLYLLVHGARTQRPSLGHS